MSLIRTLPHFPVSFEQIVCGFPILLPQKPRRTGMRDIFADMIAPLMASATSAAVFQPSPT